MIDVNALVLHTKWSDEQITLWGEHHGERIHSNDWVPLLFAWHESSFYGTFLERDDAHTVYMNALDAYRLFTSYPHYFLGECWTETSKSMIDEARQLQDAILNERIQPSFAAWKEGKWGWKVNGARSSEWISYAMDELVVAEPEHLAGSEAFFERFPFDHLLDQVGLFADLSEESWLIKIGWDEDDKPFDLLIQLEEPAEDEQLWQIRVFLRDAATADEYQWDRENTVIPSDWRRYVPLIEEELQFASTLVPSLRGKNGAFVSTFSENEAWDFLNEKARLLEEAGIGVMLPEWWEALKDLQPDLKAKVKTSSAGYAPSFLGLNTIVQFDWKVSTGDLELSEEEFMKLVNGRRRLVKVKGTWLKLDPAFIREVRHVMNNVNRNGLHLRDVLEQHLLQSTTNKEDDEGSTSPLRYVNIELNKDLAKMVEQLGKVNEVPIKAPSTHFQGSLRDYQKTGSSWLLFLRKFGLGGCLADDMGLGKTIQTIDYLLLARENRQNASPALLICPTSVLGNWQKELEQFAPTLKVAVHYGATRAKGTDFQSAFQGYDLVLTTYTTAQLDIELFRAIVWDSVIIDEAQNIKNSATKQSRSIRSLSGYHKIALTGTPVENRLLELWAIFDFLNPGYLGSESAFKKRFVVAVERDRDDKMLRQLQQLVQPFLLRRTKQDPHVQLNLPEKQEIKEFVPLTAEQASLYERVIQDTFARLEKEAGMKRRGLILALLGKLKQICDHPALYLKEDKKAKLVKRSNKLSKLEELLEDILEKNEGCLIFTQFLSMGAMIQRFVSERFGEEAYFLHGGVPKTKRDEMIEQFQNNEKRIFILSLKAGGTGLNLTEANHVIHFDRWWNPAVENQATDRAHRIGQKRYVTVHKMISLGTLEERIDDMLESKKELSEKVITSENWITELSTQELRELFVLRKEWVEGEA
ncbi:SWF/SNF family helicase [Fictibacillus macauensis ZFHKF-1]|uniref:SWF/SNF family helicase n=1 Tax=Fictibacillus macauensis ZFHKF-1 TaxID=1196324 RepID=I8J1Y6_9BACL|nr:DEAD/DEAH box helicase [Fictibacillus macauensis]EIT85761.1 SWF/SNF family helicase [Fictibacillus macauensis ZFHKF-1]